MFRELKLLSTNQFTVLTNLINRHLYSQIPLLAFSTVVTVTANSITLKFHTPLEIIHRVSEKLDPLLFYHIFALTATSCMNISRSTQEVLLVVNMEYSETQCTLLSNFNTCKFQDNWFTAKFRYLQISLLANSYNPYRPTGIDTRTWVRGTTHSFSAANLFMPRPPKKPYNGHCLRQ